MRLKGTDKSMQITMLKCIKSNSISFAQKSERASHFVSWNCCNLI